MIKYSKSATEIRDLVYNFEDLYVYSPMMSGVSFGCDCGCGGESFSEASWDNYKKDASDAYFEFRNFCHCNGIIWDYPNLFETEDVHLNDFPAPASDMSIKLEAEVRSESENIKANGVEDEVRAFCERMGIPTK